MSHPETADDTSFWWITYEHRQCWFQPGSEQHCLLLTKHVNVTIIYSDLLPDEH